MAVVLGRERGVTTVTENDERLDKDKELKVKLPLNLHLQLHSIKVLTGRTISNTVAEAVDKYIGDDLDDAVPGLGFEQESTKE